MAVCVLLLGSPALAGAPESRTVEVAYPGLACGALTHATLGELPDGVLLTAEGARITLKDLETSISRSWMADQLRDFPFFALEQEAAQRIVATLARKAAGTGDTDRSDENEVVTAYLAREVKSPEVTDEEIVAQIDGLLAVMV